MVNEIVLLKRKCYRGEHAYLSTSHPDIMGIGKHRDMKKSTSEHARDILKHESVHTALQKRTNLRTSIGYDSIAFTKKTKRWRGI